MRSGWLFPCPRSLGKPCGKVAKLKFPFDLKFAGDEFNLTVLEQLADGFFVFGREAERSGVVQGKRERFIRIVKADQPQVSGDFPGCLQHGYGVGCRAETNVPDDELAGMSLKPFTDPKLPYPE